MSGDVHEWKEKYEEGKSYEAEQDAIFSRWFLAEPVNEAVDRSGIDRKFTTREFPFHFTVQYKADVRAADTGRLFIEVISNDRRGTPGWGIKCEANIISVYIPQRRVVYLLSAPLLRMFVPIWYMQFAIHKAQNDGYATHGICVPVAVVEESAVCLHVMRLSSLTAPPPLETLFKGCP